MLKSSEITNLVAGPVTKTTQGRATYLANREKRSSTSTPQQTRFLADMQQAPVGDDSSGLPASTLGALADAVLAENTDLRPHEAIARAGQMLEGAAGSDSAMLAAGAQLAAANYAASHKTANIARP